MTKKRRYMKIVLTGMFVFLILFTIAVLGLVYFDHGEPSTLIMAVFAFCGVEGGLSAWIKATENKGDGKDV